MSVNKGSINYYLITNLKFSYSFFSFMIFEKEKFEFKESNTPPQILQLKITLRDSRPPIWRRLLVSNYITFGDLHEAIQDSFYWGNYHLHEFSFRPSEMPRLRVQIVADPEDDPDLEEGIEFGAFFENEIRLCDVFSPQQTRVHYLYDFGDNWDHDIILEKIFPNSQGLKSFICVGGKRAAPPEDCGGIYGYYRRLDILDNPSHREYEEMKNWIDDDFDAQNMRCPITKLSPKAIEKKYGPALFPKV